MATIDKLVMLRPLRNEEGQMILPKAIKHILSRLTCSDIGIRMTPQASSFLVTECLSQEFGAHRMYETLHKYILQPVNGAIGEGIFTPGDVVEIQYEKGNLAYIKSKPRSEAQANT